MGVGEGGIESWARVKGGVVKRVRVEVRAEGNRGFFQYTTAN